ncbi:MAG: MarR family transcriptional regulator [Clostridiales bacterium]|nr:MarR family transcriptional regulator [Clostridiales bacterium]
MDTTGIIASGTQLKKLISKKSEPAQRRYQLRPVELNILLLLHANPGLDTAKDIMRQLHVSKAHVSQSLDHLKNGGFICLQEDLQDRRVIHIQLRQIAIDAAEEMQAIYAECWNLAFRNVSPEEVSVLLRVAQKMSDNISAALAEG